MMRHFTMEELQTWDRFTRAHFINSMSGFKSASLVATVNQQGVPNLAIFSNIVHLGADPALIGLVNRPREAAPHTIANIEATGVYTINLFTKEQIKAAHQTSAKYAAGVSEFEATGLTPEWHSSSKVPFVKESPVKYALNLKEIIPIQWNRTFFIIGEVQHVIADETLLQPDGFLALEQQSIVTSLGIDAYYTTQAEQRLPYAKV
ncbi:MAG: flavin reductase [Chitinophagaceae bacterium]|nr:flavin reductase [Chitinophagaceae bacterium]